MKRLCIVKITGSLMDCLLFFLPTLCEVIKTLRNVFKNARFTNEFWFINKFCARSQSGSVNW